MKLFKKSKINLMPFAFLFILFAMLSACQKEQDHSSSSSELSSKATTRSATVEEIRDVRRTFGKALAKALANNAFREYIHEKMLLRYSSDYELLFTAAKDERIPALGVTLTEALVSNSNRDIQYFRNIPNIDPYLAISMPELEEWDVRNWQNNFVPRVAVMLGQEARCSIFDQNEAEQLQDVLVNPSQHTIVVWNAEAAYFVGNNGVTPDGISIDNYMPTKSVECINPYLSLQTPSNKYSIRGEDFYLLYHNPLIAAYSACGNPEVAVNSPSDNGEPCPCPRDCEKLDETLVEFKINGWTTFTNIRNQFGETKFVFHGDWVAAIRDNLTGAVSAKTAKYVSGSLKKGSLLDCGNPCSGIWIKADYRLWTDWKEDIIGNPYAIDWAEVDPGTTTVKLDFPLKAEFKLKSGIGLSAGITPGISRMGEKIVLLGNQRVFYCDPILKQNNTGSLTFKCD